MRGYGKATEQVRQSPVAAAISANFVRQGLAADGQISVANVGGCRYLTFVGLLVVWPVYLGYLPDSDGPMTTRTALNSKLASDSFLRP